jgi:signal transduction histidine kinase/ActR/RegA family two-component response regulator
MTGLFQRSRSFGNRILLLATLTSVLAVTAVCLVVGIMGYANLRRDAADYVRSQAEMLAFATATSLAFDDRQHAAEALSALRAAPEIASAAVFDSRGRPFAEYRRTSEPGPEAATGPPGANDHSRYYILHLPVTDQGNRLGSLELVYDMAHVYRRLGAALMASLIVAAAAVLMAYLFARRIRDALMQPVDELARTATEVSARRDYTVQARKLSEDELGGLTDTFNQMLSQIRAQQQDLEASAREREALLASERAARAEAERASRMKDEFLAVLSHELRTPLTAMMGWVHLLRRPGVAAARLTEGLEVIDRNVRAQTRLIEDLLDMSAIVSGKVRLNRQATDLRGVMEAALATVRQSAVAREVRLEVSMPDSPLIVQGDAGRLQQVLWNLLSNAIKFTPAGGRVMLAAELAGGRVRIVISDSGEGISAEFLPYIFERFRQADSSIRRWHGGLGLGLAIVKHLVELHDGSIEARSPGVGLGASFTLGLPLDSAGVEAPAEAASADLPSLEGRQLVVVDDDSDTREFVARLLEDHGAIVRQAGSAAEVLQLLQRTLPEVLVCDIGMPSIDGYELMRLVRKLPLEQGGGVPALALTAFAREEDRARTVEAGYQAFLAKPVNAEKLVMTVDRLARRERVLPPGSDAAGGKPQ